MHDAVHARAGGYHADLVSIVQLDEPDDVAKRPDRAIDDRYMVARGGKRVDQRRSDEPAPAGDQDVPLAFREGHGESYRYVPNSMSQYGKIVP